MKSMTPLISSGSWAVNETLAGIILNETARAEIESPGNRISGKKKKFWCDSQITDKIASSSTAMRRP